MARGKQERSRLYREAKRLGLRPTWRTSTVNNLTTLLNRHRRSAIVDNLLTTNQFQALINYANQHPLTRQQATDLFNRMVADGMYKIEFHRGEFVHAVLLNDISRSSFILQMIGQPELIEDTAGGGSDKYYEIVNIDIPIDRITINKLEKENVNKSGGFFPYINTSDIDLERYQIYTQEQAYDKSIQENREHCLIHCFRLSGVDSSLIESVKLQFKEGAHIAKKNLKEIATLINRIIVIHQYYNDKGDHTNEIRKHKYGATGDVLNIALFESHYFLYEDTKLTTYATKNYNKVKDLDNYEDISEWNVSKYKRNKKAKRANTLFLVSNLMKQDFFQQLDMSNFAEASKHRKLKNHIYLDNIDNEQRARKQKTKKPNKKPIFFADTECFTRGGHHELYLIGVVSKDNDDVQIYNVCDNSAKISYLKFMDYITNYGNTNSICYFHFLKYDFHPMKQYMNVLNTCEKDRQVYSVSVAHKGRIVEFRDSKKMIDIKLADLGKAFDLPAEYRKKEAIAYHYYDRERNNKEISTFVYRAYLPVSEHEIFNNEMGDRTSFNPTEYYIEYLKMDCLVLKKSMEKFNEIVLSEDVSDGSMSIYDYLTISSLSDAFMFSNGAYENVYEVCGNLREYIGQAVYGGRVHVNTKYKKQIIDGAIADYDGCSLYPSAIYRLCQELGGLPKGSAKRITDCSKWKEYYYAVMTVRITKVNKHQQMPFIAHKSEFAIDYKNEAPAEPIVIDKITLEDYIKFHDIEYEILDGVYWNDGGNPVIGDVIKKLYDTRLKFKKSKPALAQVLKLMLNSAYGKTITKKTHTKHSFKYNADVDRFCSKNFHTITKIDKINDFKCQITQIDADSSYNCATVGCAILSMSKRIMNEVMGTANDNNMPIYYTDTDSLHMRLEHVKPLEDEYRKLYNRELNGKQLCQFHVDFDMKGAVSEIYATKSIFLGKKSYIDKLQSTNANGDIIEGYHVRIKGITKAGIADYCRRYRTNEFGLFKKLMNGEEIEMILNPFDESDNKDHVMFEFDKFGVRTRDRNLFSRKLKF